MYRLHPSIRCGLVATVKRRVMVAGLLAVVLAAPLPAQEIDTRALESHVSLLADDLLEGRAPGTRGERMAALYLVSQLRRLGMEPLTERGYRLPVPLTAVEVDLENAVVRLSGDGGEQTLRPPAFYHPGGSRSAFRGFSGDLVFVGPAANALEVLAGYEWLDGKVVVMTPPWSGLAEVETELLRRGAAGSVQVVPNESFYGRLRIVRGPTRFFLPDGVDDPANQGHLPVVVGGGAMISALGIDEDIGAGAAGVPVELGRRFELELPFTTEERTGYNVAGVIPGADPSMRDEWIMYVAHYDHVGHGEPVDGDSIWNGFIDNVAGCAMLLEIARAMALDPPARSVAFLFVTAEEQGLLGSNWFAYDPPVPLGRIRAVLNLDGGAPPAPPAAWGLVGADDSWAGRVARETIETSGWSVRGVPIGPQSDHWPFHLAGLPSLLLFPGDTLDGVTEREAAELRDRWQREHTPNDEWSPEFPLAGMARYAELALRIGRELATDG